MGGDDALPVLRHRRPDRDPGGRPWNGRTDSPLALASLSRELAANDPQEAARPTAGVDGLRGAKADRNVELLIPTPAGVVL